MGEQTLWVILVVLAVSLLIVGVFRVLKDRKQGLMPITVAITVLLIVLGSVGNLFGEQTTAREITEKMEEEQQGIEE